MKQADIIELDSHRPHFVVATIDGNFHVIPATALELIVSGELALTELEDYDIIFRTILFEWMVLGG